MSNYKDRDKKNDEPELFSSIKELPGGIMTRTMLLQLL
jgi:hypothetical protein